MHEKEPLIDLKDTYFGLTISAHIAAFYNKSLPSFIKKIGKPYFFDPMTYFFATNLENIKKNGRIKKSFQKYFEYFDDRIRSIIELREFIPKDFQRENNELLLLFVKNILDFQIDIMKMETGKKDKTIASSLDRYQQILQRKTISPDTQTLGPLFLTAPYFYFQTLEDSWYDLSLQMARTAKDNKGTYELYPIICFSKELLLDDDAITKLIEDYQEFDGVILWVSNFDEKNETTLFLKQFSKMVKNFAATKKPVYNLYGEYFSLLLNKEGLNGYSRGIAVSEKRDVEASTTGGGQPERYYMPFLHIHASKTFATMFYSDHPELLCNCIVCNRIRGKLGINKVSEGKKIELFFGDFNYILDAKKHFMITHKNEINDIDNLNIEEIRTMLTKKISSSTNFKLNLYNLTNNHFLRWMQSVVT